ncbi:PAP fibrillin domain-containing protein [Hordeum vulgare]|nr:PAP fibrillin domain-containing protein [Hordeum vulgare]
MKTMASSASLHHPSTHAPASPRPLRCCGLAPPQLGLRSSPCRPRGVSLIVAAVASSDVQKEPSSSPPPPPEEPSALSVSSDHRKQSPISISLTRNYPQFGCHIRWFLGSGSAQAVAESVKVLKDAAKTRKVPDSEVLAALAKIKKDKLDTSTFFETLGGAESAGRTSMLIFTAQVSRAGRPRGSSCLVRSSPRRILAQAARCARPRVGSWLKLLGALVPAPDPCPRCAARPRAAPSPCSHRQAKKGMAVLAFVGVEGQGHREAARVEAITKPYRRISAPQPFL